MPATALATGELAVPPEWIDYNGHMMDGYYSLAFTQASNALLDHLELGEEYRAATGCGIYTVESHVCYRRSVHAGTTVRFATWLLGCDAKRLHAFHEMSDAADGALVATGEVMFLHVRADGEHVAPMPPGRLAAASALAREHAELPVPRDAGRRIQMR